ncbi:FAD-binding oxidoreductase [Fluviispira multicolorata]|uniref:2Fe-2S iron-sulfur cluster binding domain-containing protein n=1 Tax=Fluviispira multicolorata TaxID=2654512 RepID=A0A833JEM2_9BACT|nr:2Fe-2S iron-sulfur cluster binding domain-containing protein [Fluviispira multicolorata]KAB8033286.1 2Fe-2S iron-sulfur cluster binding domain-containing protein [Fluviispira multicolorata]
MHSVEYQNIKYLALENESVLETLLRNQIEVSYSCQSGICQSCILRMSEGEIPSESQKGLSTTHKEEKTILACVCKPINDVKIEQTSAPRKIINAKVIFKELAAENIVILKIKPEENFQYKPGQFIHLINNNFSRCYSLASHPTFSNELELHIRIAPNGLMSNWIFNDLKINDTIKIAGPHGYCYYSNENKNQNILLIAVGTGLAPLKGILKDTFFNNHQKEIHLIHGAIKTSGLYLLEELFDISALNKNFIFHPCALNNDDNHKLVHNTSIEKYIEEKFPDLSNWTVFICGNESFVKETEQQVFLQGANLNNIYSDAFVDRNQFKK